MSILSFDVLYKIIYCIILAIGIWDINFVTIPVVAGLVMGLLKNREQIALARSEVVLLLIVCYEILNYAASVYRDASLGYLIRILDVWLFYSGLTFFLRITGYVSSVRFMLSIYGGILGLMTIFLFYRLRAESQLGEWINYKYLFRPFGKLINDWVMVMFLFLPFPVIVFIREGNKAIRFFSLVIILILIYAVLLSFSRAAYGVLFLFCLICLSFVVLNGQRRAGKAFKISAGLGLALVLVTIPLQDSIWSVFTVNQNVSQIRSAAGRLELWQDLYPVFREYPFIGAGSGNFALVFNSAGNEEEDSFFTGRTLSTPLQILIEKGIIGFFLYGIWFLLLVYAAVNFIMKCPVHGLRLEYMILILALVCFLVRELAFSSFFENDGTMFLSMVLIAMMRQTEIRRDIDEQ